MKTPDSSAKSIILVVDDEQPICELCRRVLASESFEVDIAVNGKVAQNMIGKRQYDLFLVDIRMPQMDGKALYQWLQDKHPQLANRVIFTTGSVIGEDTRRFMQQTARPSLPKPFTPDELSTIVRGTLKEVEK